MERGGAAREAPGARLPHAQHRARTRSDLSCEAPDKASLQTKRNLLIVFLSNGRAVLTLGVASSIFLWFLKRQKFCRLCTRLHRRWPPLGLRCAGGLSGLGRPISGPQVHYVRNHGIVPQLSFFDHSIQITGQGRPCCVNMVGIDDLCEN